MVLVLKLALPNIVCYLVLFGVFRLPCRLPCRRICCRKCISTPDAGTKPTKPPSASARASATNSAVIIHTMGFKPFLFWRRAFHLRVLGCKTHLK